MNDHQENEVTLPLPADATLGADSNLFKAAYEEHAPEFAALDPEELLPINIDVAAAILTAHGVTRELQPFRAELEKLPGVDMRKVDQLPSYARALSHANTRYINANEPLEDVKPIYEEALALRETLQRDVNTLTHRGFLQGKAVDLTGNVGFKNVATDIQVLADKLDENWQAVASNSGVKRAEIDRAMRLADRLHVAVGEREQADHNVHQATDARARAFAVFLRVYDGIRRYVTFLRWDKGDADVIAPSLYAGRNRKKTAHTDIAAVAAVAAPTPAVTPNPENAANPANGNPANGNPANGNPANGNPAAGSSAHARQPYLV